MVVVYNVVLSPWLLNRYFAKHSWKRQPCHLSWEKKYCTDKTDSIIIVKKLQHNLNIPKERSNKCTSQQWTVIWNIARPFTWNGNGNVWFINHHTQVEYITKYQMIFRSEITLSGETDIMHRQFMENIQRHNIIGQSCNKSDHPSSSQQLLTENKESGNSTVH